MHPTDWTAQTGAAVKLEASGGISNAAGLNLTFSGDVHGVIGTYMSSLEQIQQYQHMQQGSLDLVGDVINSQESDNDFSTAIASQQLEGDSLSTPLQHELATSFEGDDVASSSLWRQAIPASDCTLEGMAIPPTECSLERFVNAAVQPPANLGLSLSAIEGYVNAATVEPSSSLGLSFSAMDGFVNADAIPPSSLGLSMAAMKTESLTENQVSLVKDDNQKFVLFPRGNPLLFDKLERTGGSPSKVEEIKLPSEASQFVRAGGFQGPTGHQVALAHEKHLPVENPRSISLGPKQDFNPRPLTLGAQQQDYDPSSSQFLQMLDTNRGSERGSLKSKRDDRDLSGDESSRGKKVKEFPRFRTLLPENLDFVKAAETSAPPYFMPCDTANRLSVTDIQNLAKLDRFGSHPAGDIMGENSCIVSSFKSPSTSSAAIDIEAMVHSRPKRRNVKISSDPQSIAARQRREKISDRMRVLQMLVPGGNKMDTASMLDEAIVYVKYLQHRLDEIKDKMGTLTNPPWTYDTQQLGLIPGMLLRNPSVSFRGFSASDCSSVSQGLNNSAPEQGLYGPAAPILTFPTFGEPGRQKYSVCH